MTPPDVGDASITCTSNANCLPGEVCDTQVSPGICVGAGSTGGSTTGAATGGTTGAGTSGTTGSSGCVIDGGTFASGAPNPANDCEYCNSMVTSTTWTTHDPGTSCAMSGGNVCQSGECIAGCFIAGTVVTAGSANPANPCVVCNPDAGSGAYTNATDLIPCSADGGTFCLAGSCAQGCVIDGGFVPQWQFRDPLQGACCNAMIAAKGWTAAFGEGQPVSTGNRPTAMTVADFNNDGRSDFAVGTDTLKVEVFLAQSTGTFVETAHVSQTNPVKAILSVDLSGDGKKDLAVLDADVSYASVNILSGDGDGGFSDAGSLSTSPVAQGLLAAPLASALPNLLVGEDTPGGGAVVIYPNRGGSLGASFSVPVTASPGAMCAAGFRKASSNDVAVLDNDGGGVSVILNESGGTAFSATAPFRAPPSAAALTSANLPLSPLPLLAVTGDDGGAGMVQLYTSLTDGGFKRSLSTNVERLPAGVVSFRRSGAATDTLATASGESGAVDVVVLTDAGLRPSASYPAGQSANALATGDFNGDSLTDFAVSDPTSGNVYILYGQCR